MTMLGMILVFAIRATSSSAQEIASSTTEKLRDLRVRDVSLVFEGALIPKASYELVELQVGEAYRPEAVRRSIEQLFALGAFSDIKVEAAPVGEEVDVIFRLYPRIKIEAVEVAGLNAANARLKALQPRLIDESDISVGDLLEVENLGAAAGRLTQMLHHEGYLWASVDPEASLRSPTAVVVFHVAPGPRAVVGVVVVEGVAPHVATDVRQHIDLTPGEPYSRVDLERSLDSLTARWKGRGFYGAEVELLDWPAGEKTVDIRIRANLGPQVRVEVDGWEFSDKELKKLVPLFEETRFTEDLIEESRANLEQGLKDRGYRDARVESAREMLGGGQHLVLHFNIVAGSRYEVVDIQLEGVVSVPESEIRTLFVTRTRGRVRGASFRQATWLDDLKEVRSYYQRRGFHRVTVEGQERSASDKPGEIVLVVQVQEGPRARIESIQVEGASAIPPADVLRASMVRLGMAFDTRGLVQARERIVNLYRNEGFRGSDVQARSQLDDEGTKVNVTFLVREGRRTRVDRVILSGLVVTQESAVRRLLMIRPGDPLSTFAVLETRQKLIGSGLFRDVDIEVLPPDPRTLRSDILVSVVEAPRTSFAYGVGYQERQRARAEFEITRRNLLGLNRTVSVFTRVSFRGGRFITTYRQPEVFGRELPIFVSAFLEEEQRTSFSFNRIGVGTQLSKRMREDQTLLFRYRFDRTQTFKFAEGIDPEDIDRRFRDVHISALSLASVTDRRNDPFNPDQGQFRILDIEWSGKPLGTEAPYLKGLAQQFFYFRLPKTMVAAIGFRLGIGQVLREDRDALLPPVERFYAGGANTLRGFALDQASPKRELALEDGTAVEGDPAGGNVISLLNVEVRFPILGNLRGVVFSDNGNVYRSLDARELLNWRYNVGFGFRYETPLGPLRVDYGFKLDRRMRHSIECPDITTPCQESLGRLHVSLGHAF
jgi:outer membrane protein insertion porin family